MNKYIFTICSNNYLAQAKTLGDSVLKFNNDYKFIIILCDKLSDEVDASKYKDFEIIEISALQIPDFEDMVKNYDVVELNTSVKPFSFDYIYKNYNADLVYYMDPDTRVFDSMEYLEDALKEYNAVLTPHVCSPVPLDGLEPQENVFTNYGIYNLGFFATKRSEETFKILDWWKERLAKNCLIDIPNGTFVDQLPMNFAPIYFEKVMVSKHLGLNAAPWNLHERKLVLVNGKYFMNDMPLIFYHFSSYRPATPEKLTTHYTRVNAVKDDVLVEFYENYRNEVLKNDWEKLHTIPCVYKNQRKKKRKNLFEKIFKKK